MGKYHKALLGVAYAGRVANYTQIRLCCRYPYGNRESRKSNPFCYPTALVKYQVNTISEQHWKCCCRSCSWPSIKMLFCPFDARTFRVFRPVRSVNIYQKKRFYGGISIHFRCSQGMLGDSLHSVSWFRDSLALITLVGERECARSDLTSVELLITPDSIFVD